MSGISNGHLCSKLKSFNIVAPPNILIFIFIYMTEFSVSMEIPVRIWLKGYDVVLAEKSRPIQLRC